MPACGRDDRRAPRRHARQGRGGQSFGLQTLAFRFFNVFGPLQRAGHVYAAVIPVFMDALLAARPLPVNGDGSNSRDFTFVGTVCQVLLEAAARRVVHEEPVNLAFGTNTTLLQLISRMESVTGRRATVDHREPRPVDVLHSGKKAIVSSVTLILMGKGRSSTWSPTSRIN